jgi:hypothetical protein
MAEPASRIDHDVREITQTLQRDVIEFLSSKYTSHATVTIHEVMRLYECPPDQAKRVLDGLVKARVLTLLDGDVYQVII